MALLLQLSVSAAPTYTSDWCSRSNVACLHGRRRLWRCSPAGNNPQLDAIFLAEPTVQNSDARLIDAALGYQVISRASAEQVCLANAAGATAVGDNISCSGRIVLQFNSKVIQSSFLIIKRTTATDVKLLRRMFHALRWANRSGSLCGLTAGGIAGAIIHNYGRRNALATQPG